MKLTLKIKLSQQHYLYSIVILNICILEMHINSISMKVQMQKEIEELFLGGAVKKDEDILLWKQIIKEYTHFTHNFKFIWINLDPAIQFNGQATTNQWTMHWAINEVIGFLYMSLIF